MEYLKLFEEFNFKFNKEDKIKSIKNLHGLPKELKEVAYDLVQYVTNAKKGKVTGLKLHPDLKKKIKEKYNFFKDENEEIMILKNDKPIKKRTPL